MPDSPTRRLESVDAGLQCCSPVLIRHVPYCPSCPWVQGGARTLAKAGGSPVCLHRFLLCLGALRWPLQMVWARRRLRPNAQRDQPAYDYIRLRLGCSVQARVLTKRRLELVDVCLLSTLHAKSLAGPVMAVFPLARPCQVRSSAVRLGRRFWTHGRDTGRLGQPRCGDTRHFVACDARRGSHGSASSGTRACLAPGATCSWVRAPTQAAAATGWSRAAEAYWTRFASDSRSSAFRTAKALVWGCPRTVQCPVVPPRSHPCMCSELSAARRQATHAWDGFCGLLIWSSPRARAVCVASGVRPPFMRND